MNTDPVADMLTRVRNANAKQLEKTDIPSSKIKVELARILKDEGYIVNYKNMEDHKQGILRVYLKYTHDGKKVLQGIRRVSRPGLRRYSGYDDFPKVSNSIGITVVSTSKGLMTDKKARLEKVGGEVIAYVW
ncbi:30S ribosomal protein S8 [Elusimicrobiota bacterium]